MPGPVNALMGRSVYLCGAVARVQHAVLVEKTHTIVAEVRLLRRRDPNLEHNQRSHPLDVLCRVAERGEIHIALIAAERVPTERLARRGSEFARSESTSRRGLSCVP